MPSEFKTEPADLQLIKSYFGSEAAGIHPAVKHFGVG